jgi:hypothetical protein
MKGNEISRLWLTNEKNELFIIGEYIMWYLNTT